MQPAKETKTTAQIAHSSTLTENGWFPKSSITTVVLDNLRNGEMQFSAVAESHIYDLESHTTIGNKRFNDVAVYYDESKVNDSTLLNDERLFELTPQKRKKLMLYTTPLGISTILHEQLILEKNSTIKKYLTKTST